MKPEQDSEAEMQRILALKRHEAPPPAFFQGFSDKVIDRIHAAGPAPKLTLRQRLSVEFYGVPVYVCAAGVVVFALLVIGVISSLQVDPPKPVAIGNGNSLGVGEPTHNLVPPASTATIGGSTGKPEVNVPGDNLGGQPMRATLAPATSPGQ